MFVYLLISIIGLTASEYHKSVLVPAYKTVTDWKVSPEVAPFVRGQYDVNLFCDDPSDTCDKKRLTYYSLGLPIVSILKGRPYPVVTNSFSKVKQGFELGTYPSDYIVNNVSAAGLKNRAALDHISFGQGVDDAFRTILLWNALYCNGVEGLDVDGICFGTLRIINALFALGHPEEYPGAEEFFTAAGIDRIDREKILSMIQTISFNASLKEPSHSVVNGVKRLIDKGYQLSASQLARFESPEINFSLREKRSKDFSMLVGEKLFNIFASFYLPSYDSKYPSIKKMLIGIEHYKRDYPQLAGLCMTKKDDIVVGGFENDTFFMNFPMQDSKKYLIPSSDFDHVTIHPLQRAAKNAFLEKYGASHYTIRSILKVGHKLLEIAQKNQYKNIGHYITEMEKQDNYNLLFNGNEFGDGNVSINELNFIV